MADNISNQGAGGAAGGELNFGSFMRTDVLFAFGIITAHTVYSSGATHITVVYYFFCKLVLITGCGWVEGSVASRKPATSEFRLKWRAGLVLL